MDRAGGVRHLDACACSQRDFRGNFCSSRGVCSRGSKQHGGTHNHTRRA